MELFNFLEVSAGGLIESAEQLWALIGVVGGGVIVNVLAFIKITLGNKKISKVTDFTVIAKKSFDKAKEEMVSIKHEIIKEVEIKVVEPLVTRIKQLTLENAKLADITVSALSLINVPLDSKKQLFEVLSGVSSVSTQAKDLLAQSILNDEQQINESNQDNQDLTDSINNI